MRYLQELASLVLALCGTILALTGIVLYFLPGGSQGGPADFLLSNGQWKALHINMALLFLIAASFHVYFNWSLLWCYFKPRPAGRKTLLRWAAPVAVIIFIVALVVSLANLSPITADIYHHHGRGQGYQHRGR